MEDEEKGTDRQHRGRRDREWATFSKNKDVKRPPNTNKRSAKKNRTTKNSPELSLVRWTKALVICTAGLVFVGGATLAVFYFQLRTMQEQAEAERRPWITGKVEAISDFNQLIPNPTLTIRIKMKNIGHSPAINVSAKSEIIEWDMGDIATSHFTEPSIILKKLCEREARTARIYIDAGFSGFGDILFPNEEASKEDHVMMTDEEVARANAKVNGGKSGNLIFPVLLTCISYQFPVDSLPYQTGLMYSFFTTNTLSNGETLKIGVSFHNGKILQKDLILDRFILRGGDAN